MSFASGTVVAGWTAPQTPRAIGETLFATVSMEQSSWIVSIYVFGALHGALPAGQLSHTFGRKTLLLLLAVPMALGWLCIMFFVNNVSTRRMGRRTTDGFEQCRPVRGYMGARAVGNATKPSGATLDGKRRDGKDCSVTPDTVLGGKITGHVW